MKIFALGAALLALNLTSCKPRSFNTTSSTIGDVASEFELANDPNPDHDFDELLIQPADDVDFLLLNDSSPDSDFL